MKYEQVAEIAKIYNRIQESENRLEDLKNITNSISLNYTRIGSFEEAEVLIKHHESKIQKLKEELTNATIGEL